ncbi:MAG: DUF481 domain-containing protein [Bdellovibrionales bacterium]|nr:DUF481 domain-containing protein [Bdellovibrionales bacterium]
MQEKDRSAFIVYLATMLIIFSILPLSAQADTVLLKNGDRITGELITKKGDTLQIKTPYSKKIEIDWHQVASLSLDEPVKVIFEEDLSISETSEVNESSPLFAGKPKARKYTLKPESWRIGEGLHFAGRVNFSYDRDRGNTDQDQSNSDIFLELRNLRNRYTINGELEKDRANGVDTANNSQFIFEYDRFITPKTFLTGFTSYEQDDFASLSRRNIYGTGVGYQVYDDDKKNLSFEVGPLFVDRKYQTEEEDQYWGTGWKIKYEHFLITDQLQFYHREQGTWNAEETDDLLLSSWTGLRAPLFYGIVGGIEFNHDYNSQPAAGAKTSDRTWAVKLGYQW